MKVKTSGAVMVVGGGVSGIQAAMDLADSGFYVYLVEKTPAIGGVMGQLDKTFPTNDCSMCVLSPYMVSAGRHPNIELVTNARLETVSGRPGRFKVVVKKRARHIDIDKCTTCRACLDVCPVTTFAADNNDKTQIEGRRDEKANNGDLVSCSNSHHRFGGHGNSR